MNYINNGPYLNKYSCELEELDDIVDNRKEYYDSNIDHTVQNTALKNGEFKLQLRKVDGHYNAIGISGSKGIRGLCKKDVLHTNSGELR